MDNRDVCHDSYFVWLWYLLFIIWISRQTNSLSWLLLGYAWPLQCNYRRSGSMRCFFFFLSCVQLKMSFLAMLLEMSAYWWSSTLIIALRHTVLWTIRWGIWHMCFFAHMIFNLQHSKIHFSETQTLMYSVDATVPGSVCGTVICYWCCSSTVCADAV